MLDDDCVVGSFVWHVFGWIFGTEVFRAHSDIIKSSVTYSLQHVYRHDCISSHRNCFIVCFDYTFFFVVDATITPLAQCNNEAVHKVKLGHMVWV